MKKIFMILSVFFAVILLSIIFQCCDNNNLDEPANTPIMTNVDVLVASEDFQEFITLTNTLNEKIKKALADLPQENQVKVSEIFKAIQNTDDTDRAMLILNDLENLIGFNLKESIEQKIELSEKIFGGKNIDSKELIKAMTKYNICHSNNPRIKTRSEGDLSLNPQLEGCITGCYNSEKIGDKDCVENHRHERPEDAIICNIRRQSIREQCEKECYRQFHIIHNPSCQN